MKQALSLLRLLGQNPKNQLGKMGHESRQYSPRAWPADQATALHASGARLETAFLKFRPSERYPVFTKKKLATI